MTSDVSKADLWQLVSAFDQLTKTTTTTTSKQDPSRSPAPPGPSTANYLNSVESLVNQFFHKTKQQQMHTNSSHHMSHHHSRSHSPRGGHNNNPHDFHFETSTLRSWETGSHQQSPGSPTSHHYHPNRKDIFTYHHPEEDTQQQQLHNQRTTESSDDTDPKASFVVSNATQLFERSKEWKRRHEQELRNLRVARDQELVQDCTFQPFISEGSRHVRGTHLQREQQRSSLQAQRLQNRRKELEEMELSQCTFKPEVHPTTPTVTNTSMDATGAPSSRYLDTSTHCHQGKHCSKSHKTKEEEECTFTPNVHLRHHHHQSHHHAMSGDSLVPNVFERLYRSATQKMSASSDGSDDHHHGHHGHQKEMGSGGNDGSGGANPTFVASAAKEMVALDRIPLTSKVPSLSVVDWMGLATADYNYADSDDEKDVQINFNVFLQRQNQKEKERQSKLLKLEKEVAIPGHPQLCPTSQTLYQNYRAKEKMKKEMQQQQQGVVSSAAETSTQNTTTTTTTKIAKPPSPKINPTKMSDDVVKRKERNLALLRESLRKKEMEGVTFQPALNPNKGVQSQLAPSRLDQYAKLQSQHNKDKLERSSLIQHQREEIETHECTFNPEMTKVPSFVSRMAQSMQTVRQYVAKQK